MKQKAMLRRRAFTRVELLVVVMIVLFFVLAASAIILPFLARSKARSARISCVNNLKEIGTAYRVWAGDYGDRTPPEQTVANGGWWDILTNDDQGALCWTNYAIMQNELGQSPRLVVCPDDERQAAFSFTNGFDNTHVSYFVGVSANDTYPQSIAGGDRNLGPGPKPDPDYGYSPISGKGNDVAIPITGPVSWSLKMHSFGNPAGAGNSLLGDGSAQQVSTAALNKKWLRNATPTTNWPAGHVPASPSIRLVFP
ncbi:MAG: type II secretion system protein [Verrucomicrobiota bacterium]|jgi:type II secretory pathway pseudopilin PulG